MQQVVLSGYRYIQSNRTGLNGQGVMNPAYSA
jgi:hypothetical protein